MTAQTVEMLDSIKHKHLCVNSANYNCAQNHINVAAVMVSELSTLVHEYPIFITKNSSTGEFQLSAVLGFSMGENLYLKGDSWQAKYLPLDILRRPFQLVKPEPNSKAQGHLAIDTASPQIQEKLGERLFEASGNPTPYLQRIQKTFSQLMQGVEQTKALLKTADEQGLIEPVTINIELNDEEKTSLKGLYAINQKAVTALKGKALEVCHQSGVLQVCHLLLSSGLHLEKLIKWKNAQISIE
ncbi:SapC family protein [Colwellia sp. MSW7]|uniref:SapC family protein n=1 Tax=Colwellia maritima TaxID=2912588 RepID=A0ABS9X147_9GAMM|nr:SapC family protein [Colwellia maritima]MCI2283939.1 SapC family protein [Colwellia maritima]